MTKVVHCKKEPYDVYLGRPSKWGNPFVIGKDGTREEVIEKYENYLLSNQELLDSLPELEGKTLGCWCKPAACHGDVLIKHLFKGMDSVFLNVKKDSIGDTLCSIWDNQKEFSDKTFGTPDVRPPICPLKHLQKEIEEVIREPDAKSEYADCFLLLIDAFRRNGYSLDDFLKAVADKQLVNSKREWLPPDKDGVFLHKK